MKGRYDNDARFWLFNTTFGKWVIIVGLIAVAVIVVFDQLGIIN